MLVVTNLRLPDNATLKINKPNDFFFSLGRPASNNRQLEVEIPSLGINVTQLFTYLVGEKVIFRKSLLGLKIVAGEADHTGKVVHVEAKETLKRQVEDRTRQYKSRLDSYEGLRTSNLCNEVFLPGSSERTEQIRQYAEMIRGYQEPMRRTMEGLTQDRLGDMSLYDTLVTTRNPEERTAWVTGRSTGRYQGFSSPQFQALLAAMEEPAPTNYFTYTRGAITTARSQLDAVPEPAPEYLDNSRAIASVSLGLTREAVTELVNGERGRPPASRGPRPRNQRW